MKTLYDLDFTTPNQIRALKHLFSIQFPPFLPLTLLTQTFLLFFPLTLSFLFFPPPLHIHPSAPDPPPSFYYVEEGGTLQRGVEGGVVGGRAVVEGGGGGGEEGGLKVGTASEEEEKEGATCFPGVFDTGILER